MHDARVHLDDGRALCLDLPGEFTEGEEAMVNNLREFFQSGVLTFRRNGNFVMIPVSRVVVVEVMK